MLKVSELSVDKLIPYAKNSRTHSDAQIAQVAASIREFGFTNPILIDEDGGIIAGHGRLLAARQLGMKKVPCIKLAGLTDTQKQAYIIADNKLALNAGWSEDLLNIEITELFEDGFNLELLGFDETELEEILKTPDDIEPGILDDQGNLEEIDPKFVTCPDCGKIFDSRGNES